MATSAVNGVRFQAASDQSLLVYFDEPITLQAHERVVSLLRLLVRRPIEGVRNVHPAYCSVLLKFDALRWTHAELEAVLLEYLGRFEAIELHSSVTYRVYFLGFVPGFAYLGELPAELVTPRLATPRRSVPPRSVGIAENQTAVYPFATPGGWRLIGRTPMAMFRPEEGSSVLSIGDRVRFAAISPERFAKLEPAWR